MFKNVYRKGEECPSRTRRYVYLNVIYLNRREGAMGAEMRLLKYI
jgi:hypothetical protein